MKWVLLGVGIFILIAVISAFLFWRFVQNNVRDKGGMENPQIALEKTSAPEQTENEEHRHA